MKRFKERIQKLQIRLREENLGLAVFAPTDHMRYLTGWAETGHERLLVLFVPAEGDPVFLVPSLNAAQAKRNPAGLMTVLGWEDATGWTVKASDLFAEWSVSGRGVAIDDELDAVHLLDLQKIAPDASYIAAATLMASLREIKSEDELAAMERSAKVTDEVYLEAIGELREGMTERELRDLIVAAYRKRGTRPEFAIVCFGANTAIPHHSPGDVKLEQGDLVLIDIGCKIDDYFSDITRTVAFGQPDPLAFEIYATVYAANKAALDQGRPGMTGEELDAVARGVIADAGYADYFIHRLGHGIGLSGHEHPYIVAGNTQELREGMCFSDEPGIYLPGRFGVRIENILTVTSSGLRSLNADPSAELLVVQA